MDAGRETLLRGVRLPSGGRVLESRPTGATDYHSEIQRSVRETWVRRNGLHVYRTEVRVRNRASCRVLEPLGCSRGARLSLRVSPHALGPAGERQALVGVLTKPARWPG